MPDVVIVGGGIIGVASAYELARRGHSVTLIERGELAAGASGRNQGWFVLSADPPCAPMSRVSLETYLDVADASPVPVRFDRDPVGHIMVARDEAGARIVRERAAAYAATGVEVEALQPEVLRREEPALTDGLIGAHLLRHGRRIDPGALTVALAHRATELGADIRRHDTVRAPTTSGDRVTGVVADAGLVFADTVVVAAGPWTAPMLQPLRIDLPITGERGWIVELLAVPSLLHHLVEDEDADIGGVDPLTAADLMEGTTPRPEVGTIVHSADDGTVVCGASHQLAVRAAEPEETDAPARVTAGAIRLVPSLSGVPVRSIRWGIRPMSPDGRPLVGWVQEGLLVAGGHGPEGVLLGGGTGSLVASLIAGDEPPFDPQPFDPLRFGRAARRAPAGDG